MAKTVRLSILGADPGTEIAGIDEQPGKSNYFSGADPKFWRTGIPHFGRVQYRHVYPGIDLVFYAKDGQLEYDFVVAPHANARLIRMKVDGARLSLTGDGDALIGSGRKSAMKLKRPRVFAQGEDGNVIQVTYRLRGNELSLALGAYDRDRTLVIDPALAFSTSLTSNCVFLGGAPCTDTVADMAADSTGVYIVGATNASNFPATRNGPQSFLTGFEHTFVLKLDPTGSQITYITFLGTSFARRSAWRTGARSGQRLPCERRADIHRAAAGRAKARCARDFTSAGRATHGCRGSIYHCPLPSSDSV